MVHATQIIGENGDIQGQKGRGRERAEEEEEKKSESKTKYIASNSVGQILFYLLFKQQRYEIWTFGIEFSMSDENNKRYQIEW